MATKTEAEELSQFGAKTGNTEDCLFGDTLIVTSTGEASTLKDLAENNIEALEILATNDKGSIIKAKAHSFRAAQVTETIYIVTTYNGHTIRASANHLFLLGDNQWVKAEKLQTGDVLKAGFLDGKSSKKNDISLHLNYILTVDKVNLTTPVTMYDFTVDTHENLFIGQKIEGKLSLICVHSSQKN